MKMKNDILKFSLKMGLFLSIVILIVGTTFCLSATDDYRMQMAEFFHCAEFITVNNGPNEIKPKIQKVQDDTDQTMLILGDSMCAQMFRAEEWNDLADKICINGTNAAITMTGQYILLEQFLEYHENVTDVWLILRPHSISSKSFGITWGYQYMIMPFVETDTIGLLEADTVNQLENICGSLFLKKKTVRFLDQSAIGRKIYLNHLGNRKEIGFDNDIGWQYLEKMKLLCDEKEVALHLLPAPVADTEENREIIRSLQNEYDSIAFGQYFSGYFQHISYFPPEQSADGVHFSDEYSSYEIYREKLKEWYAYDRLVDVLKL